MGNSPISLRQIRGYTQAAMSARAKLSRRVLEILQNGQHVPTEYAFQLRNWALRSEDTALPLEEIARRILRWEENSNAKTADQG